ncbi:hypothetical protein D3C81_441920 [compost metagenome]
MSWGAYHAAKRKEQQSRKEFLAKAKDGDKDWTKPCENCDAVPTVHPFGLCGPCCFGEADTINGNW